jgi:UDP-3-O-[3-hydroxymyristoyl] glucosamine N-acyltransferase
LSFFKQPAGITIGDIVAMTGAEPRGGAPLDRIIADIASLGRARPSDLTFLDSPKLVDALASTRAAACLTTEQFETRAPAGVIVLVGKDPMRAFITVARHLHPDSLRPVFVRRRRCGAGRFRAPDRRDRGWRGHRSGRGDRAHAGIGSGTVIGPNAVIGPNVQIGRDCSIGPNASIVHALIGDGVIIHAGSHRQTAFRYQPGAQRHASRCRSWPCHRPG